MNPVFQAFNTGADMLDRYYPATKKSFGNWLYNNSANSGRDITDITSYKFDTSDAQGQFDAQRYDSHNALQIRVRDALKAGINPLAAIGAGSSHYSPTITTSGDSGNSRQSFRLPSFDFLAAKQARQDRAIALESANLDLEGKRLQNDILRQKLLTESQPGIPSAGSKPAIGDLYLPWKDRDGNIHWLMNPDAVADADITNIEALKGLLADIHTGVLEPFVKYSVVGRAYNYLKSKFGG